MEYNSFKVEIELTGITRKKAAEALSSEYNTSYTFNQETDTYTFMDQFDREWHIAPAQDILCQQMKNGRIVGANNYYSVLVESPFLQSHEMDTIRKTMEALGEGIVTNETTLMSVAFKSKYYTETVQNNLRNIFASKGQLMQKAIGVATPEPLVIDDNQVKFQMFKSPQTPEQAIANLQLAQGVNDLAHRSQRISPVQRDTPNEKYTMRCWLLRLKMVGKEYSGARKEFTKRLAGNSSWLMPETEQRWKKRNMSQASRDGESVQNEQHSQQQEGDNIQRETMGPEPPEEEPEGLEPEESSIEAAEPVVQTNENQEQNEADMLYEHNGPMLSM